MATEFSDPHVASTFNYAGPPDQGNAPKKHVPLCKTPLLKADVQVLGDNGANNLHSHTGSDGFWYVLKGRAKFYNEHDEVVGDLGPTEGILTPHDTPYWFESTGRRAARGPARRGP